jgi:polysaccharide pyruvyl transferase WcaK-like protein
MRRRIARALSAADLVIVGDPESRREVLRVPPDNDVSVAADPALLLEPADPSRAAFPTAFRRALSEGRRRVGVCISAQRAVTDVAGLVQCLDGVLSQQPEARIFFLPMNPVTDAALMSGLRERLQQPERSIVLEGHHEPAVLALAASLMDVVVSSRLHLLILAANSATPIVGIGRGSKIETFLRPYGLEPAGDTENLDRDRLRRELARLLGREGASFRETAARVRSEQLERLHGGCRRLGVFLGATGP